MTIYEQFALPHIALTQFKIRHCRGFEEESNCSEKIYKTSYLKHFVNSLSYSHSPSQILSATALGNFTFPFRLGFG